MAKTKLRRRRRTPRKPKFPISNITGFPAGMSHADLRRKFPILRASIAEHILADRRKIRNLIVCFHYLPFKVRYDGF